MTRFGDLLHHPDYRVRMIAIRRAWALEWRRQGDIKRATENFAEAHARLREAREAINAG